MARRRSLTRVVAAVVMAATPAWLVLSAPRPARAFGDVGAFDPRALVVTGAEGPAHPSAPGRWSWELIQRTSAPARSKPTTVRADDPRIVEGPFLFLSGSQAIAPLSAAEIAGLRRYFALGGLLLVDDAGVQADGEPSAFGASARRELARVLPDQSPIDLGPEHVLFRTFYLIKRAEGRVAGPKNLSAIVRSGTAQVVFTSHDVTGALARSPTGVWELPVVPGADAQRERAIRLAVNIAMYVLCSNYKDDQVHAPFLMRRRALSPRP